MARIAFVQNILTEYIGIMYLASLLKEKGHEVRVFLGFTPRYLASQVKRYHPDIAAFSCTTGLHEFALSVAKNIKLHTKATTLFGGPHPTFFPEIINEEGVDAVCRGEGEYALLEFAQAIDQHKDTSRIRNLWVKKDKEIVKNAMRPLIDNLDELPFPDRDIYYRNYPFMDNSRKIFMAGRGCPYDCTYCFNGLLKTLYKGNGEYIRIRSVNNVISEIEEVRRRYKLNTVYMLDDTFVSHKAWLMEFLEAYHSKINVPFICTARADLVTEEMARKMKAAGCSSVFFGVESGEENMRNLVLGKKISDEQIINAAAIFKKHKINFRAYNMLGIPGETIRQGFMTVDLNIKIKTDYPWCSILQPYPGTPIEKYARRHGVMKDDNIPRYFFKKSILNSADIRELSNLQKLFYFAVKMPFLRPLIKVLIKLPPNPVFNALFRAGYARMYYKSERFTFGEIVNIGLHYAALFISSILCIRGVFFKFREA